jgi:hypothetical protein
MPADIGEFLIGAYLEHVRSCDVISYDHALSGEQGDIDVLGLNLNSQQAFAVEVKTHIGGLGGYGGQPGSKKSLLRYTVRAYSSERSCQIGSTPSRCGVHM